MVFVFYCPVLKLNGGCVETLVNMVFCSEVAGIVWWLYAKRYSFLNLTECSSFQAFSCLELFFLVLAYVI